MAEDILGGKSDTFGGGNVGSNRISPTGAFATDRPALQAAISAGIGDLGYGTFVIDQPLVVDSRQALRGLGAGTIIQAAPSFVGAALITLAAAATEQVGISDLTLDGNKANITSGAVPHGILLYNSGTLFPFTHTDAHDRLRDLFIYNCGGNGVMVDGQGTNNAQARESKIRGVNVYTCDGHGIYIKIGSDVKIDDCVCGNNGRNGLQVDASAVQISHFKAFGSGQVDHSTDGSGLRIKGGQVTASDIVVQDNLNYGALLEAIDFNCSTLTADSNGTTASPKAGVRIAYGKCTIHGLTALDRWSGGSKVQAYGVDIAATDFQSNIIDHVTVTGRCRDHITADVRNQSSGENVTIEIDGNDGRRARSRLQIPHLISPLGPGVDPKNAVLSSKTGANTNGARWARVTCHEDGEITDLMVFPTVSTSGNIDVFILDTGEASPGNYTRLYSTGSIPVPAASGWRVLGGGGSTGVTVKAGQEVIFGWSADTGVPALAHHNLASQYVNMNQLPAGYNVVPGGASPKRAGTALTVMPFPTSISEANLLVTNGDCFPLIVARIT